MGKVVKMSDATRPEDVAVDRANVADRLEAERTAMFENAVAFISGLGRHTQRKAVATELLTLVMRVEDVAAIRITTPPLPGKKERKLYQKRIQKREVMLGEAVVSLGEFVDSLAHATEKNISYATWYALKHQAGQAS